jgi:hypothetical protein
VTPASGGLDAVLACYRNNGGLRPALMTIVEQFARGHYVDLFFTHLRSALPALPEYLAFLAELTVCGRVPPLRLERC